MSNFINRMTLVCLKHNMIPQSQEEFFRYGLELLISSVISIVSYLTLGILIGKADVVMCILITLIPLQSFGGGYHADSHARCYFTMLIGLVISLLLVEVLGTFLLFLAILACVPIYLYAPVEHKKAPFSRSFAEKMRRIVRILLCIFMVVSATLRTTMPVIAAAMATGVFSSGVSIVVAVIQQRRIVNPQ